MKTKMIKELNRYNSSSKSKYKNLNDTFLGIMILISAILLNQISCLGQIYQSPQKQQFQILKVKQQLYFNQNNTFILSLTTQKKYISKALISYSSFYLDHYIQETPQTVSWFNIRTTQIQKTYVTIYSQSTNQSNNTIEYHCFDILISCVDQKYFQIVNWQYNGPQMTSTHNNFFSIQLNPKPKPFDYCFSDQLQTIRQDINFMLNFNGIKAANWISITRDVNYHFSRFTFHIYPSDSAFEIHLYSDIKFWADKHYFGMIFYCPNSYVFKRKYAAQMKIVSVGSQNKCMGFSDFSSKYVTLKNSYNYTQFIGIRFISPNLNQTSGYSFEYEFSLTKTSDIRIQFYNVIRVCGWMQYNILFVVQKKCIGNRTFVQSNGTCICNQTLGFYDIGVDQCDLRCALSTVEINYTCILCKDLFGVGCSSCNQTDCQACNANFILSGNQCKCYNDRFIQVLTSQCVLCSVEYNAFCTSCDDSACLSCMPSYQLITTINQSSCKTCNQLFGTQCINCTSSACLSCGNGYSVSLIGQCICGTNQIITINDTCASCESIYGLYCSTCNITQCQICINGYQLANDNLSCICPSIGYFINSFDNICMNCQSHYNQYCLSCNSLQCSSCNNGYNISQNKTSCQCDLTSRFIVTANLSCLSCAQVYGQQCQLCNQIQCLKCVANNYKIINLICICSIDRFQFLDQCFLCEQVYGYGCQQCNNITCTKCKSNWSNNGNNCTCLLPNSLIVYQNNLPECRTCQQLQPDINNCKLEIYSRSLQIGSSVFVQLYFNHANDQLIELIPFYQNIQILQGNNINTPMIKQHYHNAQKSSFLLLEISLLQRQLYSITQLYLTIQIINKNYIKWKSLSLSNNLSSLVIQPFTNTKVNQSYYSITLNILITAIQWTYPLMIILSFTGLNNGFQMWFIIGYYIHLSPENLYGLTEDLLLRINQIKLIKFIPDTIKNALYNGDEVYQNNNSEFKQKIFYQNSGILQSIAQIFTVYVLSIIVCLSIRYYIKKKRYNQYGVYYNFIHHCFQYLVANFYALYPFIGFYLAIQFQCVYNKGQWKLQKQEQFINFIISISLALVMMFVPFIALNVFPLTNIAEKTTQNTESMKQIQQPTTSLYAFIYTPLYLSSILTYLEHFIFKIFKTPIYLIIIFCFRSGSQLTAQLSLICFNIVCLFVTVINYRKYVSRMYWFICSVKLVLLIAFEIAFLFLPIYNQDNNTNIDNNNFSSDTACFIIGVLLISYDLIQLLIKLIRIIISNKLNWSSQSNWNRIAQSCNKIVPLN